MYDAIMMSEQTQTPSPNKQAEKKAQPSFFAKAISWKNRLLAIFREKPQVKIPRPRNDLTSPFMKGG
jgi:hypothetical protein